MRICVVVGFCDVRGVVCRVREIEREREGCLYDKEEGRGVCMYV